MATIEIKKGLKFTSKHYPGETLVTDVNKERNVLSVRIFRSEEHFHDEDDWNLKITEWAFESGDYTVIEEKDTTKHLLNKHGQLEDEGAYAD